MTFWYTDMRVSECPYCHSKIYLKYPIKSWDNDFFDIDTCSSCGQKFTVDERLEIEKKANLSLYVNWFSNLKIWIVIVIFVTIFFQILY